MLIAAGSIDLSDKLASSGDTHVQLMACTDAGALLRAQRVQWWVNCEEQKSCRLPLHRGRVSLSGQTGASMLEDRGFSPMHKLNRWLWVGS